MTPLSLIPRRSRTSSPELPEWPFIKALAERWGQRIYFLGEERGDGLLRSHFDRLRALGCRGWAFPEESIDIWGNFWIKTTQALLPIAHGEAQKFLYNENDVRAILRLVGEHPNGPPQSSSEFLQRLNWKSLRVHRVTLFRPVWSQPRG